MVGENKWFTYTFDTNAVTAPRKVGVRGGTKDKKTQKPVVGYVPLSEAVLNILKTPMPEHRAAAPQRTEPIDNITNTVDDSPADCAPDLKIRYTIIPPKTFDISDANLELVKILHTTKSYNSQQNTHTPFDLCFEILGKLQFSDTNTFLVISNLEFVVTLIDGYGVSPNNIYFVDEGLENGSGGLSKKTVAAEELIPGENVFASNQFNKGVDMKFDFVVGNPPFSTTNEGKQSGKRSVVLYPEFFKKSVALADCVAMIMPDTSNYVASAHNDFLIETNAKAFGISENMHAIMGIIIKTWFVVYNKSDTTPSNIHFTTSLEDGNDLPIQKGKINLSTTTHFDVYTDEFSVPVIKGMTRRGMEMRYIRECDAKYKLLPGQYAVVFPLCVQPHGWTHVEIVAGCGQCFNINTFYIVVDSIEAANDFKKIITSDEFISQANALKGNSGTMGLEKMKKIKI